MVKSIKKPVAQKQTPGQPNKDKVIGVNFKQSVEDSVHNLPILKGIDGVREVVQVFPDEDDKELKTWWIIKLEPMQSEKALEIVHFVKNIEGIRDAEPIYPRYHC